MAGSGLDVDSVIERLLSVRGQPNNRTVQLAERVKSGRYAQPLGA